MDSTVLALMVVAGIVVVWPLIVWELLKLACKLSDDGKGNDDERT